MHIACVTLRLTFAWPGAILQEYATRWASVQQQVCKASGFGEVKRAAALSADQTETVAMPAFDPANCEVHPAARAPGG